MPYTQGRWPALPDGIELRVSPWVDPNAIVVMARDNGSVHLTPEEQARLDAKRTAEDKFVELATILGGRGIIVVGRNVKL